MIKRIFTVILSLVLIVVFMMPSPALAAKPGGNQEAVANAVALAGDRLLATQGLNSGPIPYNWEWKVGDGNFKNSNLQGITASGLLAAFEKTGSPVYLAGAKHSGDILKVRFASAPASRPYAQDVEFLARLTKDSADSSYLTTAQNWYGVLISQFTAVQNVNRYITARGGSLAGWDLASQIRAANATGNTAYAQAMADELIRRSPDWVNRPSYGYDYTILAYGSLLWTLRQFGDTYDATINQYRQAVVAAQLPDGSWDDDYQTTAYLVLGLDAVKGQGAKLALNAAGSFLVSSQTALGGWVYAGDGEYPEVNSEVNMALATFKADEGLHKGQADPKPGKGRQNNPD